MPQNDDSPQWWFCSEKRVYFPVFRLHVVLFSCTVFVLWFLLGCLCWKSTLFFLPKLSFEVEIAMSWQYPSIRNHLTGLLLTGGMKASTYHELAGYTSNVGSCQFTAIGPGGRWLDGSPALLRKARVNSVKDRADEMKRNIIVSTHVNIQHPWRNIWTTKAFFRKSKADPGLGWWILEPGTVQWTWDRDVAKIHNLIVLSSVDCARANKQLDDGEHDVWMRVILRLVKKKGKATSWIVVPFPAKLKPRTNAIIYTLYKYIYIYIIFVHDILLHPVLPCSGQKLSARASWEVRMWTCQLPWNDCWFPPKAGHKELAFERRVWAFIV